MKSTATNLLFLPHPPTTQAAPLPNKLQPRNIRHRIEAANTVWGLRSACRHVGYAFNAEFVCAAMTKLCRLYQQQQPFESQAKGSHSSTNEPRSSSMPSPAPSTDLVSVRLGLCVTKQPVTSAPSASLFKQPPNACTAHHSQPPSFYSLLSTGIPNITTTATPLRPPPRRNPARTGHRHARLPDAPLRACGWLPRFRSDGSGLRVLCVRPPAACHSYTHHLSADCS